MIDSPSECIVLGGGGHATVVIDALQLNGVALRGVLDPDVALHGTRILGVPVLGGDDLLDMLRRDGAAAFVLGVGSVERNPRRREIFERGLRAGLIASTVIHPTVAFSKWAPVGPGTVVLANAVINAGARVGANVIVNSGAIVEHGSSVGDHAHVASGARIAGNVRIGAETFIGAGATVKQGISIGGNAVVGAGTVVLRNVPAGATVVGVPGRIV
jgi:sugar O-acyltransferase (sialic acid O-acetyltransferase NeuD family)